MTLKETKIQQLLQTNPQFKTDTLALLNAYRKLNWSNITERKQFRKQERTFRNKWGCDFSIIAFHYHGIQGA